MSNADILQAGGPLPAPEPRAPRGGAVVGGVRYEGGQILPPETDVMILRRTVVFTDAEGQIFHRRAAIPVPANMQQGRIDAAWERFLNRWREMYDLELSFVE